MLALALSVVIFGLWVWSRDKRNKDDPPRLSGALPILGHAPYLFGDTIHFWERLKTASYHSLQLGGVMTAKMANRIVYDPDDALTVMNHCLQKAYVFDFVKPWLGEGLLTGHMSTWKHHRRLLKPAFSQAVLDGFLGVFNSQARRLVQELSKEVGKGPFDHGLYTRYNGLETVYMTAFGIDFNENHIISKKSSEQYVQAIEKILRLISERMQKFWLHYNLVFKLTGMESRQNRILKILHNASYTVLNKRKADYLKRLESGEIIEKTGTKFKPFMDLLLELAVEEGAFDDREIQEHVDTMIVAGHDTSANVLMYALLLIGSYPHVQEKIVEEIHQVFGTDNRDVTKQDISQLVYIEAVLKESMRLYPIVPMTARVVEHDLKLKNCTLYKGRNCYTSIYGLHRHPVWGPDASEFKPERWFDTARLPECSKAFAPFNIGKRACVGQSFAYTTMKIILVHVLRHYKIHGDSKKMVLKFDTMLKPVRGHFISIEKRS